MKVRNLKGYALEIAVSGQIVEPGVEAEVEDATAKSLLEQADVWAVVTSKPEPKPADIEETS